MTKEQLVQLARTAARQYGLPEDLFLAQITQESGWNPKAVSPAGAGGIAQFMPATGQQYGLTPDERFDPSRALPAAAKHMRDLYGQFGSWELALAAYNAGPGAVRKHGGVPPFKETQNYVPAIMRGREKWRGPVDTRMAAAAPTAGVPAVDPNTLPDRGQPMPTIGLPMPSVDQEPLPAGMTHPMLSQALGQRGSPTLPEALLAFGTGVLGSRGGNWFGSGANAVQGLIAQDPGDLSALEVLQANNELWELDERRRQDQMTRKQSQQRQAMLEAIVKDPAQPGWRREQAQMELSGLGDVFEAPKSPWATEKSGTDIVRVNAETGETEVLYQGEGDSAPKWYGGGQPVMLQDGRQGIAITNDQGQMEVLELPEGAELRSSPEYQEGVARAQQRGREVGKDEGQSIAQFPVVEENAFQMTSLIDDLLADEAGIQRTFGVMSKFPSIPGGKAADYEARLARLGGMSFLQAYQSLKGGGQITEVEGQQAKDAIVALATAQSPDQFKRELQRLRQAVTRIYERERSRYMPDRPSIFGEPAGDAPMSGHDPLGIL